MCLVLGMELRATHMLGKYSIAALQLQPEINHSVPVNVCVFMRVNMCAWVCIHVSDVFVCKRLGQK